MVPLPPLGNMFSRRAVEAAIWHIGKAFSIMGYQDPRLIHQGRRNDIRIQYIYHCYTKEDPPQPRVKTIILQIIRWITNTYAS